MKKNKPNDKKHRHKKQIPGVQSAAEQLMIVSIAK
jgi:hypothetical protein